SLVIPGLDRRPEPGIDNHRSARRDSGLAFASLRRLGMIYDACELLPYREDGRGEASIRLIRMDLHPACCTTGVCDCSAAEHGYKRLNRPRGWDHRHWHTDRPRNSRLVQKTNIK